MSFSSALVTGATGFLGRALVKQLHTSNCRVTALVRRQDGLDPALDRIIADIRDPVALRLALAGRRFDVVFHLAAAGVAPGEREPGLMFATNAAATGALVEICAGAGAQGVVYAGSCSEYAAIGNNERISEDDPLTRDHLYGVSKIAGGVWGTALARNCGVTFCWLRLFGIYGPGEARNRLIPYLARRLAFDEPVDLTPGEQVRDLTYVDDAARALLLAGELAVLGNEGPFNVCTGQGVEVRQAAGMVCDHLGKPRELLRFGARPYRPDEPMRLVGDPTRFGEATAYSPQVDLEQGIRLALETRGLVQ